MKFIFWLLKDSYFTLIVAVTSALISGACSASIISLINTAISQNDSKHLIWYFFAVLLTSYITNYFSHLFLFDLSRDAVYKLQIRLSHQILAAPLSTLERLGPDRLLATLIQDVENIANIATLIPFLGVDLVILFGCLLYLCWLSSILFVFFFTFLLAAVLGMAILLKSMYGFKEKTREETDYLYKKFQDLIQGVKELKLNRRKRSTFLQEELQLSASRKLGYERDASIIVALVKSSSQFLFLVLVGIIIFISPQLWSVDKTVLSAYVLTLTYILGPLQRLFTGIPDFLNSQVSLKKLEKIGLSLSAISNAEATKPQLEKNQVNPNPICFKNIEYQYEAIGGQKETENFRLGPLSLTIYPGECIFIIGGNGSGKSTLVKLLTGLYFPQSGNIFLGNELITKTNLEWYQQHFSPIFTDFYLFNRILEVDDPLLDDKASEYLKQLKLDNVVSVKDGYFSTTDVSYGQKKRLALLIAYLENRPIYLFDEWAANQDPSFRKFFYHQILAILKQQGKTVILISHDDQFFHMADRIFKLDCGQLIRTNL